MPSLNALGEFKSSFYNIANEREDVKAKQLPFDDLALPTTEAPPFEPAGRDAGNASPAPDSGAGAGNFDFSAFLDTLGGDAGVPIDDMLQDVNPPSIDELLQDGGMSPEDGMSEEASSGSSLPADDTLPDMSSSIDDLFQDGGLSPEGGSSAEDVSSGDGMPAIDDLFSDLGQPSEDGEPAAGDSSAQDELLPNLPDNMESASPDFGAEDFGTGDVQPEEQGVGDSSGEDIGAIDMGGESPEVIDMGGESPESSGEDTQDSDVDLGGALGGGQDSGGEAESGFGDESHDDALDGSIDLGGESPETERVEEADSDSSLGDFMSGAGDSSFDSPMPDSGAGDSGFDSPMPDADSGAGDSGFDSSMPDIDFSGFGTDSGEVASAPESSSGSGVDDAGGLPGFGDISSEFESESIELGSGIGAQDEGTLEGDSFGSSSFGDETLGSDDFALPGLEEIFDKSKAEPVTPSEPKKGLFGRRKKEQVEEESEVSENIEEIALTQEDVDKLLKTLSSYPLNLRVACEELIAEQVILPQQLSKLIRLLVNGAPVRETAAHAESILGKTIVIPRGFEKMTGAAFEAEQASFAYIFVHNFLPVLRLFAFIAALLVSIIYLGYKFIYIPLKAESIYQRGYERIPAGEYQRANELFHEAFTLHRKKKWFYSYAEAFRDQRRYMLAEGKYDELLRFYPRDKKGVLDYSYLETYYLMNYDKANRLLQQQLLDYAPDDYDGLLAAGDNFLAWADSDPSRFYDKYEDARFCYARLLELYKWQPQLVERMMRYFIRTDNLREVLYLRVWFENDRKRLLSPESISELGGYLLDKQLEQPRGVPNPYVESIESVRDMLLGAVREKPELPEPHYHLARYYNNLGNVYEERLTLENAVRAFNLVDAESVRRRLYRVDTYYRYANILVNNKEFFPAEEQLVRGIELYEDYVTRNLISTSPQLGQLYAAKGDIEYFVKSGNMEAALNDYRIAERYGYAPPEIKYRMGSAYYQLEDWRNALEYLFRASAELPLNRRLLHALGNVTYQRGDYFAAQGYYNRLLDILENQRVRLPVLLPNDGPEFLELGIRLMMARNNAGVVYEALAEQTGNRDYRSRAIALYAESAQAWDSITRNPQSMERMRLADTPGAPGVNLGYLNANNLLRPANNYSPQVFPRIDKDVLEPSKWEELAPYGGLQ
jgi:tetratricopeptide (TPR) repeat protein